MRTPFSFAPRSPRLALLTCAFLSLFLFASPQRAWACCSPIFSDPGADSSTTQSVVKQGLTLGADIAGWAAKIAQYAKQAYQWVIQNMGDVIDTLTEVLDDEIKALTDLVAAQAEVDAQSRETQKKGTLDNSMPYLMNMPDATPAPAGEHSGYNACAMSNSAVLFSGNATDDLTRALELFTNQSKMGVGALADQQRAREECFRGLRNTQDPNYGTQLQKMGCPSPVPFGGKYIDTDTMTSTVLEPAYYSFPANATLNLITGQMTLPYAIDPTGVSTPTLSPSNTNEMDFVAAMFACRRFRAPTQLLPNTNVSASSALSDASAIEAALDAQSASSAVNNVCVREVARRTRVSQAVANAAPAGGVLQEVYESQVARCQSQNDLHILNPEFPDTPTGLQNDLDDCTTNGRSEFELDRNEACKYDRIGYAAYLAGTGLPIEDHIELTVQNESACSKFVRQTQRDKARAGAIMNPKSKKSNLRILRNPTQRSTN